MKLFQIVMLVTGGITEQTNASSQNLLRHMMTTNGHFISAQEPSTRGPRVSKNGVNLTCPLKIDGWKMLEDYFSLEMASF